MSSKYFTKTGAKNSGKKFVSCLPLLHALSEREVDEQELIYRLHSVTQKSQEERFLDWMMDLSWNMHNPLCHIRETIFNEVDPYDPLIECYFDERQEQYEFRYDAEELLRNSNLSPEEQKFVQIEFAWSLHAGQAMGSSIDALTWKYGAGAYLNHYNVTVNNL